MEKNDSIFINKSNIKTNNSKNIIIQKDINDNNNNPTQNNLLKIDDLSNSIKIKKNNLFIYMNKFLIKPKYKNNGIVVEKKKK